MVRLVCGLALVMNLVACAKAVQASDYDQSCVVDDDCVAVEAGDVCRRCGALNAAINVDDANRFIDDSNDRSSCGLWNDIIADCFCGNTSIVACQREQCVLVQSNCAPVLEPASFSITSPSFEQAVPTNVDVLGERRGDDADGPIVVTLIANDETTALTVREERCALIGGCALVIDPGTLPASSSVELAITIGGNEQRHTITVGDEADVTPPVVGALAIDGSGVSGRRDEQGAWRFEHDVQLIRPAFSDDGVVVTLALERRLDGGAPVLLEREPGYRTEGPLVDNVAESEGATEACYVMIAWDSAGNEGRSPPLCVDVTIDEDDKPPLVCGAGGTAPIGTLALLLVRRRRRP